MLQVWRFIAASAAVLLCSAQAPSQRIEYTLTPLTQNGALQAVQVDLTFRGQGDGETELRLPDEWGGEEELWRSIEGLLLVSGAEMRDGDSINERILTHAPNARIHVRYRIVQDYEGPPPAGRNAYRPVIQPGYFHLIGEAAFVTPDLHPATPARVRVRNLPRGWAYASDLQHPGLQLGRIWASITVGGDYRVHRAAADRNIRVAIRGDWSFSDEAFTSQVGDIISGQRRFWNDRSSPYLVTVTQTFSDSPGHLSMGGTGLDDAFAFFATANAEEARIARTLAHESFHTWIPGRIGGQPEEGEAANYWLTEGFTDFYMGRTLVREGLWTPQQFADDFNETLLAYARSPVREAPNARIAAEFWSNYAVQQLPYQRGRLLAAIWDARLRAQGASLDEVVHDMRARALAGDPLKAADMFPVVMENAGADVRADIEAYALQGRHILLPEDVFAPCGRIVMRETPVFDRGWNAEALESNGNVVTGVDPELPAYAAGMRDGMTFVRRDGGVIGDAETPITYVVRDGDGERAITYYPRGRGTYLRQTFQIDAPLEGERYAQCRAVLGGAH